MDSRIQVQLEEDGAAARNRAEAGEEWSVAAYVPPGVINETQVKLFSNKSQ